MKIVFMGTPDFALEALKVLHPAHDIVRVYTRAPKPSGRGHKLTPSVVHQYALEHNLPVSCPASLRTQEAFDEFISLKADLAVVAAYGMLLPQEFLNAFPFGCWNIHGSLLPRWRGAAPIQRAIMAGDKKTGITLMQMDSGLDTGDILLQKEMILRPDITAEELYADMSILGAQTLLEGLSLLKQNKLSAVKQSTEGITYATKIQKEEGKIDWSLPAEKIDCIQRGLSPYPGAWFPFKEDRVSVIKAVPIPLEHKEKAGTVLDDSLLIACGKNALRLLVLKKAGKRAMQAKDFLNGHRIVKGTVL